MIKTRFLPDGRSNAPYLFGQVRRSVVNIDTDADDNCIACHLGKYAADLLAIYLKVVDPFNRRCDVAYGMYCIGYGDGSIACDRAYKLHVVIRMHQI